MTPAEMGMVFSLLLKHREIHGNPPDRPLRDGEMEAARILADCSQSELQDINEFLSVQGFTLYIRDGLEFGIPAKARIPNRIYVMTRLRGESLAAYLEKNWVLEHIRDGRRRNASKAERVVWLARMWLTLQWFFYERIDRLPSEVSRYREALVNEKLFLETLSNGIEQLGNAGQPAGAEGVAWTLLWEHKESMPIYAGRFLKAMLTAGMIQDAGNTGEYRQTLVAAVDMAVVAEHELAYLMPTDKNTGVERRTLELVQGQTIVETDDADPAAD
ncbi:hypothetical protein FGKAn22_06380 [Ferrigenium kumadai]|uniref:Uncharacterized protein n=1 Tax=Ferrigenium kumadai TaxID=1682490 RepID=A0AAN1VZ73_9PROT|nr:hypothetical protein [Ferrigenium kumadai]BBI98945.1 hypothetical protein FGKAn22_06380 [Ferrigenium kumadai]